MNHFFILLGSNQHAEHHLNEAMKALRNELSEKLFFSSTLESFALDSKGNTNPLAKPYLNVVCSGITCLNERELRTLLKNIEAKHGRLHGAASKGIVTLDLDLVEWNGLVLKPEDYARAYYKNCKKALELTIKESQSLV